MPALGGEQSHLTQCPACSVPLISIYFHHHVIKSLSFARNLPLSETFQLFMVDTLVYAAMCESFFVNADMCSKNP